VGDWGPSWSADPKNVFLKDGKLYIRMQYEPHTQHRKGNKAYYTAGGIKTKADPIKYGYFEARIHGAERQPGVVSAFWGALNYDTPGLYTEIDFLEMHEQEGQPHRAFFSLHVFDHPRLQGKLSETCNWLTPWDMREYFHVYGCEWNEQTIKFYVDGQLVDDGVSRGFRGSIPNEYFDQAVNVILSMELRWPLVGHPTPEGFPTEMKVDYVRVWQNGGNGERAEDEKR